MPRTQSNVCEIVVVRWTHVQVKGCKKHCEKFTSIHCDSFSTILHVLLDLTVISTAHVCIFHWRFLWRLACTQNWPNAVKYTTSLPYPNITTDQGPFSVRAPSLVKAYITLVTTQVMSKNLSHMSSQRQTLSRKLVPITVYWGCAKLTGSNCAHALQLWQDPAEPIFLYILWCQWRLLLISFLCHATVGLGSPENKGREGSLVVNEIVTTIFSWERSKEVNKSFPFCF